MDNSPISPRLIRWAFLIEASQSSRIRRASTKNALPAGVNATPLRRLSNNSILSSHSRSWICLLNGGHKQIVSPLPPRVRENIRSENGGQQEYSLLQGANI